MTGFYEALNRTQPPAPANVPRAEFEIVEQLNLSERGMTAAREEITKAEGGAG